MLPEGFLVRMRELLGDEYDEFISALSREAVRGMRVNLIKANTEEFIRDCPFELRKIPYCENGFILESDGTVGKSAEHHAGMIYMQDPGAMATLSALDIDPEWSVADLCAAPGGKSSQIAERLRGGFLLSNEYVPKRAKILVQNLERLGARRAVVTSLDTGRLCEFYRHAFDLVVADAPCSGEGMFRKSDTAIEDWSEENIKASAKRQGEILENAAVMVKSGGYLIYSTCTYAPEENELTVAAFLRTHPDFRLIPVRAELERATRPAIATLAPDIENMCYARRCYPHITEGEGQFVALMQRDNDGIEPKLNFKDSAKAPTREEVAAVQAFFKENLVDMPEAEIKKVGMSLCLIPHGCPVLPHSVFMSGVLIGEVRGKLLFPSHQLFSAYGELFLHRVELTQESAERYLYGEEIDAPEGIGGWCALFYRGAALGGGKASGGKIKNHYPKGLRNK